MKALSVVRPAGTKIVNGLKTLEVRRWAPEIRAGEEILLVENENFLTVDGQEETGEAVAIITLGKIREFRQEDIPQACASYYEEGWMAWEIRSVKKIEPPFPVRAARKLYEIDDAVIYSSCLAKKR
ncbi:TPA: ASCH domain-containing protein [Klebsiella aerogenes]|nr:ASCH domain-containing protein [Klebsiella aerogenes]